MKKDEIHKLKNDNFIDAMANALSGIWCAIKTQRNIRIQLIIAITVIIYAIYSKLDRIGFLYLIFAISFVIFAELINTAIEATVDLYTKEYNKQAQIAKDIAAGAVLITSINALVVACFIFIK